ncbi:MAG: pyridoxamine 5'-phosphate oxidase [Pelagibacteraceae bacterium]|nr:pyridoxamine 5'-phosphate oxidase [Pelagibacteraceae bacterium]
MNELDLPNHYDDLDLIYNEIWTSLIRGKKDSKSEFHQCYVSTHSDDYPSLRTVVLRHADKENLTISFHTDIRSNKINHINDNPNVTVLLYSHDKKIQIQIKGTAEINNQNERTSEVWKNIRSFSKKCYIVEQAPGSKSDVPLSGYLPEHEKALPDDETLKNGYKNFALIDITIEKLEWLYLHRYGHRRALFEIKNKEIKNKQWLTP